MKEVIKEPEITLFGRKIVLPENSGDYSGGGGAVEFECCSEGDEEKQLRTEEEKASQLSETNKEQKEQESSGTGAVAVAEEPQNPKTPSINEDILTENNPKSENDQSDAATTNGQQKTLKKPDKILPCPRCNSSDTKFCYYNNYNVNQPRHFCKSCQRYWTAGGTMRNVPVGAGRRKNKNSTSHCRHITLSEALDAFKPNGTVLSFGTDPEKQAPYGVRNGYHNSRKSGDNVDENGLQKPVAQNINGFPPPAPFVPLPFPIPAICPPIYPMPFYPNPYWNIPWMPCPSSALGKHSRNGELLKQNSEQSREGPEANNTESSIVVPKTLRIDDPEEAAKSSIWETLGIKYGSVSREGLFKALQPKVDERKSMISPSSVLQANPAALSRSITFQERA